MNLSKKNNLKLLAVFLFTAVIALFAFGAQAENIDPDATGCKYAWAENVGWINFKPALGSGVTVTDASVTGMAWGENVGWINLSPANGGVMNDGTGKLSGYAWSENVGWINFKPSNGGVNIGSDGKFSGYAWGENIGWINFSSANSCVKTAWVAPGDTTPPIISGTPANIISEATSSVGAIVSYSLPTAVDAVDGAVAVTCSPSSGSMFPLGNTTVTCSASDKAGNTATPSFTVTIRDTTPPVITVPEKISSQAPGSAGVVVVYTVIATDIVDGAIITSCTPSSGTTFLLGTTTVNCSAKDAAGNTATASFTVFVWNINPNPFTFAAQTDVTQNTLVTSNTVTVLGINAASPISIAGGSYSINGGAFVSAPGFVNNGDTVQVQQTSSGSYLTQTDAVLTIGGVSATFSVTTKANTPPTANAGMPQTVHAGSLVMLDGSASSDPDGDVPLTYAWSIASKPYGSAATLSDPGAVKPSLTPDLPGDYQIELVVTDSLEATSLPVQVKISTTNTAPVADAGPDQAVTLIGSVIQLDGSKSWDPDGDSIRYQWKFTSIPAGSTAVLSNATSSTPSFIADVHGTYNVQLIVSDQWSQSAAATVTVSFTNVKPVANAGTSQSAVVGDTVTLDGSGSTDANGDTLTYSWSLTTTPAGSLSAIASPISKITSFVPDMPGLYVAQLIVNDGFVNSDPATIEVQVASKQTDVIDNIRNIEIIIGSLDGVLFKNPNMKNALINKLNAVIASINDGNYSGALDQIQNDILAKMDGCATGGAPDKNDWIINCRGQDQVYLSIMNLIQLVQGMK